MADSMHLESALIQQFANYGLIGGVAFMSYFFFFIIQMRDRYLRALAVMVSATYIYYPGSESIPVVGIWLLIAMCDATTRWVRAPVTTSRTSGRWAG